MPEDKLLYKIVYSSVAEMEILEASIWYENQKIMLGDRFVGEVIKSINKIAENPHYYSIKTNEFREAIVNTFPYLIVYRINEVEKLVRVLSVFHTSRNPNKK